MERPLPLLLRLPFCLSLLFSQLPPIFCTAINLPGFSEVPYTFPVIVHPAAREACYILLLLSTDSITIELWMGASIWDTENISTKF